jgi:subtilase family serine protease
MRHNIHPARLTRYLPAFALLLGVVLVAGCTGGSGSSAAAKPSGSATPALTSADDCLFPPASCYTPDQYRAAYGIQPLLNSGIDGRGETVTDLEIAPFSGLAGPPPSSHALASPAPSNSFTVTGPQGAPGISDIRQDLARFDSIFRLPAARIEVVNSLAHSPTPWLAAGGAQVGGGEVGDLEELHMIAPAATLRVVLLPAEIQTSAKAATAGMLAGLRLAVSGTDVVSISWDLGEHFFTKAQAAELNSILQGAAADHVTVVASTGDTGPFSDQQAFASTVAAPGTAVKEVSLPASDPSVLAVGGTTLTVNSVTGAYIGETAWNTSASFSQPGSASAGGFSQLYARPAYQDGVPGIGAMRGVPDVAGDADAADGAPIVLADGNTSWIIPAFGTEAAAPLWAGLMALADQYAHHDLGFVNPAIYRIARSSSYRKAFHDVTTGNNVMTMPYPIGTVGYKAAPGWDPATGWGSPNAQVLVPLLAAQPVATTS